ncbi:hypothetical protein ACRAWF_28905 [Streptomyces sp. L7]
MPLVLGQEEGWPLWSWLSLIAAALLFRGVLRLTSPGSRGAGAPR